MAFTSSDQGAVYVDSADLGISLDGSGNASFTHAFDRAAVFDAEAILPDPISFDIDNTDTIVVTATRTDLGTSEFSAVAEYTLPGDFDLDGDVDFADIMTWQRGYNSASPEYTDGDADFDGDVDNDDYAILQANYGFPN